MHERWVATRVSASDDGDEPTDSGDGTDSGGGTGGGERVQVTESGTTRRSRDDDASDSHGADPTDVDREFGWRGYVLLGILFLAFVVAPLGVFYRPLPLSWRFNLILFPLLPAVALGVAAVWATTRP